ncbi:MAG: type II/IV secretion system ATPase subunit [Thermoplasmata archaeon]
MHRYPPDGKISFPAINYKEGGSVTNSDADLELVETYPINQYVTVEIRRDIKTARMLYRLVDAELGREGIEEMEELRKALLSDIGEIPSSPERKEIESYIRREIEMYFLGRGKRIGDQSLGQIHYILTSEFLGYGKIDAIMNDSNIEDISCDGVNIPIYVYHKKYQNLKTNVKFESDRELNNFIVLLAQKGNKQISISDPILDATTPEGNRINATFGHEVTARGGTFSIRLFKHIPLTPIDLVVMDTASSDLIAYLWLAIEHGKNIIIIGGTGVGKTSTLNAISLFIPPSSKIVSIEDTKEINIPHKNWIGAVTRVGVGEGRFISGKSAGEIDMFDLLVSALRQRPDYMLVGEVRGKEAYNLFQAMTMGQTTLTTMHAESVENMITRLESQPLNIPRTMLPSINIVVRQSLVRADGTTKRRLTDVSEIIQIDSETNEITFNTIFSWNQTVDKIVMTGESAILEGLTEEFKRRKEILKFLAKQNVTGYSEMWKYLRRYYQDPEKVYSEVALSTDSRRGTDA